MTDGQKAYEISNIFRSWDVQDATYSGCVDMAEYKNNQFREVIEKVRAMAHAHQTNPDEYEYSDDYNKGFIDAVVAIDKLWTDKR